MKGTIGSTFSIKAIVGTFVLFKQQMSIFLRFRIEKASIFPMLIKKTPFFLGVTLFFILLTIVLKS
jgi:hypothetical protein